MKKIKLSLTIVSSTAFLLIILLSNNSIQRSQVVKNQTQKLNFLNQLSEKTGHLNFTFKPENLLYKPGSSDTHFVYTQIKADIYNPLQNQRLPLNICLVIDRSGSMSGDRIVYVKQAAEFVINNLTAEDYLSIVIYDQDVQVLKKPTKINDKQAFLTLINGIYVGGSTNLCGGLTEGYHQIKNNFKEGYVNRVLLLSDGLANQGITDPQMINQYASSANLQNKITTSSFGVGNDFNENLMMGIAESGAGNYYYIKNPNQIKAIFEKELSGLLSVVAQNTKVKIGIPKGARVIQLYGQANISLNTNEIEVLLRDISSEEEKSFLFSYVIDSTYHSNLDFNATLTYDNAVSNQTNQQLIQNFSVVPSLDQQKIANQIDNEILAQFAIFHSNWLMSQAMKMVDQNKFKEADVILGSNEVLKLKYANVIQQNVVFQTQDSLMINYKNNLSNYQTMSEQDKKIIQKSNKSQNYIIQKRK
jgi:Ca-activated chloride channel homolog